MAKYLAQTSRSEPELGAEQIGGKWDQVKDWLADRTEDPEFLWVLGAILAVILVFIFATSQGDPTQGWRPVR
jgi:hypothetical protein